MRVFVTGGSGFVGSHTVAGLLGAGHQVRLLIRDPIKMHKVFDDHDIGIDDYVTGDVTDAALVRDAMAGCDAVLHCAGIVATSRKMEHLVCQTNVGGTENVVGMDYRYGSHTVFQIEYHFLFG